MNKVVVFIFALLMFTVPVPAEEVVSYEYISFESENEYGEQCSAVQYGEGYALSLTEAEFDVSGKSFTGDIIFDFSSEEAADITVSFSGDGIAAFEFHISEDTAFSFRAKKDRIKEKTGDGISSIKITASAPVLLTKITSERIPTSILPPIVISGVFIPLTAMC